jgi:hypothetical protein
MEMRRKWNTYFTVSQLQYKNSKHFKLIYFWNVSFFPFGIAPNDSRMNQKHFFLSNEPLVLKFVGCGTGMDFIMFIIRRHYS